MRPGSADGHGLWFADTRFLSEYRLLLDGREPELVDLRTETGWMSFELASGYLRVRRERFVDQGLHERITIVNSGPGPVDAGLELVFAADFAAMMAVRGIVNLPHPPAPATQTSRGLAIKPEDGSDRSTEISIAPAGTKHLLRLGPGEKFALDVDAVPVLNISASSEPSPQPSVGGGSPPQGAGPGGASSRRTPAQGGGRIFRRWPGSCGGRLQGVGIGLRAVSD